jgi:hypothetical protein
VVEPFLVRIGLITAPLVGRDGDEAGVSPLRHPRRILRSLRMAYNSSWSRCAGLDSRCSLHASELTHEVRPHSHSHRCRTRGVRLLPVPFFAQATKETAARQAAIAPGVEIMTNYGLYGTVLSVDRDTNMALIRTTPERC